MDRISSPLVGFRFWLWPPLFPVRVQDFFPWGNSLLLWGTVGLCPWAAAEQTAKHMWNGRRHVNPWPNCVCGLHAFTRLRARPQLKWFDQWPSAAFGHQLGLVAGAVVAWGTVAEHGSDKYSEGFRAEHMRILALSDREAAALYRVPCVNETHLELYASEFGVRLDELHS